MGFVDDTLNNAKDAVGNAKEWIGDKTDNESLERQGEHDQRVADAERVKDGAGDVIDDLKH